MKPAIRDGIFGTGSRFVRMYSITTFLTSLFLRHIHQPIQGGNADIYGGEAGFEFLATRWLTGFANFSYQEINQTFTADARRGGPRFKWNAGLRGEWDNGLSGEILYHYVGAATYPISQAFTVFRTLWGNTRRILRVDSYNLLNLRGAYKFWQQKAEAGYMRDAEVAISAFNALNDEHKEHPLGRYDRQPRDGMDHGEILRRSSEL